MQIFSEMKTIEEGQIDVWRKLFDTTMYPMRGNIEDNCSIPKKLWRQVQDKVEGDVLDCIDGAIKRNVRIYARLFIKNGLQ